MMIQSFVGTVHCSGKRFQLTQPINGSSCLLEAPGFDSVCLPFIHTSSKLTTVPVILASAFKLPNTSFPCCCSQSQVWKYVFKSCCSQCLFFVDLIKLCAFNIDEEPLQCCNGIQHFQELLNFLWVWAIMVVECFRSLAISGHKIPDLLLRFAVAKDVFEFSFDVLVPVQFCQVLKF